MFDLESINKMNERVREHKARQALRNGSAKRAIGISKTVPVAKSFEEGLLIKVMHAADSKK